MASPSYTYTLTNGTTADASHVMQNFNDILNGVTDGTKDLSISALTCAGTATLNGNVNLGNASSDDLTITASLASTLPIKTTNSYDIGSSTLGLRALYLGANSQTVKIQGSSSMSATWTFTAPINAGTAYYVLKTDGSGNSAWTPPAGESAAGSDADTSLTVASARTQIVVPTADRTYTLPTTSVLAGDTFTFVNNAAVTSSNLSILINSSGANLVRTLYPKSTASVIALQNTPTSAAHWACVTPAVSNWTAFTPTGSWSSNTTYSGFFRRCGENIEVNIQISLSGAPTAASLTVNFLPGSLAVDTAKIPSGTSTFNRAFGLVSINDNGADRILGVAGYSSTTAIAIFEMQADTTYVYNNQAVNATNPVTFASGDTIHIMNINLPISGWTNTGG